MISNYTLRELMVVAAGREIRDKEVVFVGMRLPLFGFLLAKKLHAPNAIGVYENGIIREGPSDHMLYTMGDPPNIYRATACSDMLTVMGLLQQGRVDVGFIGGAEVDRYGNLNTTSVITSRGHHIRLPGSGGACDIASLSHRLIAIMAHEKRRFQPRVSYVTSPGYGEGKRWREQVGLVRGGPAAILTDKAILRFDEGTREAVLVSVHPGITLEEVLVNTGWPIRLAENLQETPPPTTEELEIIRAIDPEGFWIG